ncbi:MAG: FimV/HubP family polar landmark protein [Methylovulum sp.]|nr:FimV/HubP family polar landmark protein [Methylovulum sp.]
MRLLTKTLAVISLLMPASAYPLGIGEIKLHSALNQNLDAEISLILSLGEKLADIKVNLAPPDKFDENGVPWTYFLSKIKFEAVPSNGSAVIKISSKEAFKEPFLNFLLEVSWAKGSLYREFTVLVDPPEVYKQAAIPVMSAPSDDYGSERNYVPEQPATRKSRTTVGSGGVSAGGYGPTTRNDTLWKIAQQVSKDSDVSVEQMLIALYEENPHAFYKANVNALLAGKTLKVPERDVILKLSRKQAVSEFNRQLNGWRNNQAQDLTTVETGQKDAADNQLTLIAPVQEPVPENATVTSGSGQQAAAEKKANIAPSVASDEDTAQKNASSPIPVNNAIQDKIAALEKQLAMMQELVALKDQQLAALQNQSQVKQTPIGQSAPAPVAVAQPEAPVPVIADVTKPVQPKGDVSPKPAPSVTPAPQKPAVKPVVRPVERPKIAVEDDTVDGYYLGVGGAGAGILIALGWLWWRQRRLGEGGDLTSPYASAGLAKAAKSTNGFSDSADDSNYGLDLAVGENIFASDFAVGDFDVIDMDQGEIDPISEADVYLAYGRYQQAEDLMREAIADQPGRDECKLKLLEIYYANGNKQAFEMYVSELIEAGKQADIVFWAKVTEMGSDICADSPLFSAKFASSDLSFEGINQASAKAGDAKPDELIDDMALDMATFEKLFDSHSTPDLFGEENNLFGIGSTTFEDKPKTISRAISTHDAPKQNNESVDFDIGLFAVDGQASDKTNRPENIPVVTANQGMFGEENNLFDIDSITFEDKPQAINNDDDGSKQNNESIDFDLSLFAVDNQASDQTNKPEKASADVAEITDEFESFDFDFSVPETKAKGIDEFKSSATETLALDDDFHSIDFLTDKEEDEFKIEGAQSESYHAVDFSTDKIAGFDKPESDNNGQDSFDDFDFNIPSKLNGQSQGSFGVTDLAEMDEMETKLDLAIAYIDMGDNDAAREIALEVLKKGTAEQRIVAQALVDGL